MRTQTGQKSSCANKHILSVVDEQTKYSPAHATPDRALCKQWSATLQLVLVLRKSRAVGLKTLPLPNFADNGGCLVAVSKGILDKKSDVVECQ